MFKHVTGLLIVMAGTITPALAAAPVVHSARPSTSEPVGLYGKCELRIDMDATYTNPFDPEQIDLWAEVTAPSGKVQKIWGFYNPSQWSSLWMVRFAPTEKGTWRYVVKVKDQEGTAQSRPGSVTVVDSAHHGFIRIAPNQRYLMYGDGTSFYGVGLWHNDGYELFNQGAITETSLDELKRLGGNFISFFPTPLETMGSGLGRYDENRCGRLDQLFEWCEARDIHISWNIWFHSYISQAIWGGGNARYRHNPYHLITDAAGFFGSTEAWRYQEKLYRYMIARWGYSRALFLWFIVDEINGTEGWEKGDKAVAEAWCRKVDAFFNEHDPYGRPTTGTQSGGIGQWWPGGYKIFDIAAREIYEAQGHPIPRSGKVDPNAESPLRYSYRNYATQTQNLWKGFEKPALVGECGWDHTYYEPGMPGYLAMYHNALWVSLANGLCCTPFWWAWSDWLNDSVVTNQMRYFSEFVADIDWAHLDLRPVPVEAGACDAWALQSDKLLVGWVVHPKTSVAKESFTISGLPDRNYEVRLYRTWRGRYLDPQTLACREGKLTVTIPELTTTGGHALHIGNDVAFKIVPK
ncbi:MAG: DUF5060 domain-containing protein [Planctomycetes bacterium]|jgi:hypothetical protein|nr:DUF5060 domain-containing protein [Planctomycetota bacterium]